jgi:hypothetical protein
MFQHRMKVAKKRSNKMHLEGNGGGRSLISWENIGVKPLAANGIRRGC